MSAFPGIPSFLSVLTPAVLKGHVERINKIVDPVLRYTYFIEVVRSLCEGLLSLSKLSLEEQVETIQEQGQTTTRAYKHLTRSLEETKALDEEIKKFLDDFTTWVQQSRTEVPICTSQ